MEVEIHARARWLSITAALSFAALTARAAQLVATAPRTAARTHATRHAAPHRGRILAADGTVLAESVTGYEVDVTPSELLRAPWAIDRLAALLGYNDTTTLHGEVLRATQRSTLVLRVRRNVDPSVAERIRVERAELPGVWVSDAPRRHFPLGELTSIAVGFMGDIDARDLAEPYGYHRGDRVGRGGLERAWELTLRGVSTYAPAHQGMTLATSLDLRLQTAAARALGDRVSALVALDPRDGRVLAYLSLPVNDPATFETGALDGPERGIWPEPPRHDRVIASDVTERSFPGLTPLLVGLTRDLATSCDATPPAPGAAPVDEVATSLGLGHITGIDLRDELAGAVRLAPNLTETDAPPNGPASDLRLSITPLQIAVAFSAIANGGVLYQPRLVDRVLNPDGSLAHRTTPVVRARTAILPCARDAALGLVRRPYALEPSLRTDTPPFVATMRAAHHSFVALAPARDPSIVVVAYAPDPDALAAAPDRAESAALAVVRAWRDAQSTGARP
jgi:penicillin-binding protein 2